MKTLNLLIGICLLANSLTFAQMGIGTTNPNENSILHIESNTKGILAPKMTTAQKNTLGGLLAANDSDEGMLIFDTDLNAYYYWNGTLWSLLRRDSLGDNIEEAIGNIYLTAPTSIAPPFNVPTKLLGTTAAVKLINFDTHSQNNRLRYIGNGTGIFSIICSLSFNGQNNANDIFGFYITKGYYDDVLLTEVTDTLSHTKINRFVEKNSGIGALSISGVVDLENGEWIEVWAENGETSLGITIETFNLLIQAIR